MSCPYWVISRYSSRKGQPRFNAVQVQPCDTLHEVKSFVMGERDDLKPELMVRHTLIIGHTVAPDELTDRALRKLLKAGWEEFSKR